MKRNQLVCKRAIKGFSLVSTNRSQTNFLFHYVLEKESEKGNEIASANRRDARKKRQLCPHLKEK